MGDLALSLSRSPILLEIPTLQMILSLAKALFLAPALTLFLAPALALFLAPALVLVLPLILGIVQAVAMTLGSAPLLLQASETQGQIWSLIMPPGVTTATGSLRNNPGNFCKYQNLAPEDTGSPLRLKGRVRYPVKHCHGASAFSTTGRRREPPTTWIKSQACKMALRVSFSDMDTRGC